MSTIQKVAVIGANGDLGQVIVPALLQSGFSVTAISRPGGREYSSKGELDKNVDNKEAAYDDLSALTAAFQGQDAVVEAFNPAALTHQRIIVRAAVAAGVKHLITNEFAVDDFHPIAVNLPPCEIKVQAQRDMEDELHLAATENGSVSLAWTGIITGLWIDVIMRAGLFWLDPKKRTITRFGSGTQKINASNIDLNGEAVVAVLQQPERFKNRPFYVSDYVISTNELIEDAKAVSSDADRPWEIIDVPDVESIEQRGRRMWDEDTQAGVVQRLRTEAYVTLALAAIFNESNGYGAYFGEKLEAGWGQDNDKFRARLKELIKEFE